jgi:hypothetical protein
LPPAQAARAIGPPKGLIACGQEAETARVVPPVGVFESDGQRIMRYSLWCVLMCIDVLRSAVDPKRRTKLLALVPDRLRGAPAQGRGSAQQFTCCSGCTWPTLLETLQAVLAV